jgi:spoIIIJ-associated protein
MQLDLTLECKEEGGVVYVNLTGQDRPFLLSNSASVLNSMEFLLNKTFRGGKEKEDAPGIILDSDHYRQHREAELVLLAQMAAKKVIAQRKPLGLQPMTPRERRIVHLALAGIDGVRSQSEGEGDNRSVTIFPS